MFILYPIPENSSLGIWPYIFSICWLVYDSFFCLCFGWFVHMCVCLCELMFFGILCLIIVWGLSLKSFLPEAISICLCQVNEDPTNPKWEYVNWKKLQVMQTGRQKDREYEWELNDISTGDFHECGHPDGVNSCPSPHEFGFIV